MDTPNCFAFASSTSSVYCGLPVLKVVKAEATSFRCDKAPTSPQAVVPSFSRLPLDLSCSIISTPLTLPKPCTVGKLTNMVNASFTWPVSPINLPAICDGSFTGPLWSRGFSRQKTTALGEAKEPVTKLNPFTFQASLDAPSCRVILFSSSVACEVLLRLLPPGV